MFNNALSISYSKYKSHSTLSATAPLFENKTDKYHCLFHGQPHMYMVCHNENNTLSCYVGIGDNSDFDYYKHYTCIKPEQIHELINILNDCTYAQINNFDDVKNIIDNIEIDL